MKNKLRLIHQIWGEYNLQKHLILENHQPLHFNYSDDSTGFARSDLPHYLLIDLRISQNQVKYFKVYGFVKANAML